jgi:PTS system mannitol-specific IIC component
MDTIPKEDAKALPVLDKKNIIMGCKSEHHEDAVTRCGQMLKDDGYVTEKYIEGMLRRDRSFSTAIGNLIAIPHGEMEYKKEIRRTGVVIRAYPDGLDWSGERVKLVIGIAANNNAHLAILERIAEAFDNEDAVDAIVSAGNADAVFTALADGSGGI